MMIDDDSCMPNPMGAIDPNHRFPVKVDVAFDVLAWASSIENHKDNGRKLSLKEKIVYESALEVLRLYLAGEMTFDEPQEDEFQEQDMPVPSLSA